MPNLGGSEILIILLVVVLIFGSAKLPQLARSLGKSARILKAETKGLREDEDGGAERPADTSAKRGEPAPARAAETSGEDPVARAAQLRAEAARLEREAGRTPGELPAGEAIQGVPVSDYRSGRDHN